MPRRTVDVRLAGPADADVVLELIARMDADPALERPSQHPSVASVRARVELSLTRRDVEVLLAVVDAEVVGAAVLHLGELLTLTGGPVVRVDQLYVVPGARRRGVARQLLMTVVAAAERTGADEVTCVVPPGGRDAHRFLARLGFARLVTLRAVPVARLRSKLAGEHEIGRRRVALDALVARRRRQLDRPETPAGGLAAVAPLVARTGRG